MEGFGGGEICELVRLYFLDKLSSLIGRPSLGLYRDDGLAAINDKSGPVLDKIKKTSLLYLTMMEYQ